MRGSRRGNEAQALRGIGPERRAALGIEGSQIPQLVFKCIDKLSKALNEQTELCDNCVRKKYFIQQ